jgi:hypothetical protein
MEPRISIITLGVSDLQRSIQFYRDGLELPMRDWEGDIAFFETSATWLSLFPEEKLAEDVGVSHKGEGVAGFTLAHNVRSREEVDQIVKQAASAGAEVVKSPQETNWGGYSGYFADPDGFLWEVAWNPHFTIE